MRTLFTEIPFGFAAAAGAALTLAACTAESESANAGGDDLPETTIAEEPEAVSDEEIAEAVPGVAEIDTEGDASSTADGLEDGNMTPGGDDPAMD